MALPLIFAIVTATVLLSTGWYFLFRTARVVDINRRAVEEKGAWSRVPWSGLVRKNWFPLFIRLQGILACAGAVLLLGLITAALVR